MTPSRNTHHFWLLAAMLALVLCGCSSKKEGAGGKEKKASASATNDGMKEGSDSARPAARKPPAAPFGKVILEARDIPNIGKVLVPKGAETANVTKNSGSFRFPLTKDGFSTLYVEYSTDKIVKSKTLKKAKGHMGYLVTSGKIASAKTLPSGIHLVVSKRAKDKKVFVFAFPPQGYVECWGPDSHLDDCLKIAKSVPMPGK